MLEYFPIENFNKKISVSRQLWEEEQKHYQQQTELKKRNFRLVRLAAVLFILLIMGFMLVARPHWVLITIIAGFVLAGGVWTLSNIAQKEQLLAWRDRNNRLFATPLKQNILLAFFTELQFNQELKSTYKSLKDSLLLEKQPKPTELHFQAEGLFNGQSLLLHRSSLPIGLFVQTSSFLGLIRAGQNPAQFYFSLKSQPLAQFSEQLQHFGYFADLERDFNFYSSQRGFLAEFIQQNEQILQRISNLRLDYLCVSIQKENIYCSFDNQLLAFWDKIEIETQLSAQEMQQIYEQLSKLQTLCSLLQQLHIPSSQPEESGELP